MCCSFGPQIGQQIQESRHRPNADPRPRTSSADRAAAIAARALDDGIELLAFRRRRPSSNGAASSRRNASRIGPYGRLANSRHAPLPTFHREYASDEQNSEIRRDLPTPASPAINTKPPCEGPASSRRSRRYANSSAGLQTAGRARVARSQNRPVRRTAAERLVGRASALRPPTCASSARSSSYRRRAGCARDDNSVAASPGACIAVASSPARSLYRSARAISRDAHEW